MITEHMLHITLEDGEEARVFYQVETYDETVSEQGYYCAEIMSIEKMDGTDATATVVEREWERIDKMCWDRGRNE
tara:strand:- start:2029 stop:2253 length:225 start_codon:yes stop_codon:yes gene_type:complete